MLFFFAKTKRNLSLFSVSAHKSSSSLEEEDKTHTTFLSIVVFLFVRVARF